MHVILLVFTLLSSSRCLAEFVITAHDPMIEEFNREFYSIKARGLFGFDIENYLKKNGYPFENHVVTTTDGYVLAMHRIPYGRNSENTIQDEEKRPAVLIMHGLGSSSVDYLITGPDKSIGMILADQGYDVWLGNNRGNTWSKKHETLDPDKNKTFWDFSFHELGIYDLPAMIDYILDATKNEKISYIGHSQGTTEIFVLTSEKPEYNDKFNVIMAMAPTVYCQNMPNPIVQVLKNYYGLVEFGANYLNLTAEILGHSFVLETALKLVCKEGSAYEEVCPFVLFLLFGFDSDQFDRSMLPTYLEVFPAGLAMRELMHFLQMVKSAHFRQFDHGVINNLDIYNQPEPPGYKLSQVTAPVVLYYAKNDWLSSTTNVEQLAEELPNVLEKHLVEYDYFNHLDFIVAKDVVYLLYFDLVNKLNEINGFDPITSTSTISTSTTTVPTSTGSDSSGTSTASTDNADPDNADVDSTTPSPGAASSFNSLVHTMCIFMLLVKLLI